MHLREEVGETMGVLSGALHKGRKTISLSSLPKLVVLKLAIFFPEN